MRNEITNYGECLLSHDTKSTIPCCGRTRNWSLKRQNYERLVSTEFLLKTAWALKSTTAWEAQLGQIPLRHLHTGVGPWREEAATVAIRGDTLPMPVLIEVLHPQTGVGKIPEKCMLRVVLRDG